MTCAYAVRRALRKIDGVASVDVSLNKGLATIRLRPGNSVRPEQFWQAVRDNGFTPKTTHVSVRGTIVNAKPELKVSGSGELLQLSASAQLLDAARQDAGKAVRVEGTLTPGKDVKAQVPLVIAKITPEAH